MEDHPSSATRSLRPLRYEGEEFEKRAEARTQATEDNGRIFSSFSARLGWPEREVLLHLKGGSRVISMTTPRDGILREVEQVVVYEREG